MKGIVDQVKPQEIAKSHKIRLLLQEWRALSYLIRLCCYLAPLCLRWKTRFCLFIFHPSWQCARASWGFGKG